ncbi:LamG-like jellyroll fold domain-containing protein [Nocardia sp. NPDC051321]|uniref:LamG-like jellyroll fold domain-containing protein n=1 Tax=Nocardia sp. NPDC051321 TaxID=3364323 RepID=UPI0037B89D6C
MTNYPAAVDRMAGTLTTPFAAGADRVELTLATTTPLPDADFASYDFVEHRARFDAEPRPRYLVTVLDDLRTDITMTIRYVAQNISKTSSFIIPAGTLAGASMVIPLGAEARSAVLKSVSVRPPQGEPGPGVLGTFRFTVLLGDLAALLWVLGGERDLLAAQLNRVRLQHTVEHATGLSLDLIGSDLSIPRFPPRPYGFAADTIALYHLEDKADTAAVFDAMTLYSNGAGHPGVRRNATPGVDGRFGYGMGFLPDHSVVEIADHTDFALPATASCTAECFVRPAAGTWQGAPLSKHADLNDETKPGWGLQVGPFRGLDRNVRLLLTDGATKIELFADVSLDTDRFHHLAAVLDRGRGLAGLFVDGVLKASQRKNLGALTNNAPVRLGFDDTTAGHSFYGTLDEVRISRRALTSFDPVLGEGDTSYRQRLGLFRRWNLPTPANIADALNGIAGRINDVERPITVSDAFVRSPVGSRTVTIRPVELRPGETIDARGRKDTTEAEVCGTIADDQFDPRWLTAHNEPRFRYVGDEHRIRQSIRRCLDALVYLVMPQDIPNDRVLYVALYDPSSDDLRAVGRAVVLRHPEIAPGTLAALAHRAGFSWVQYRAGSADVYASIADISSVEIPGGSGIWSGKDLVTDSTIPVVAAPLPPTDSILRWSLLQAGPGRAEIVGATTGNQITLRGLRAGEVTVKLEARLDGKTFSATQRFTIGLQRLAAGMSIGADGTIGVAESVAGTPADGAFSPEYLVTVDSPSLEVAVPGTNRMQANVAERLGALLSHAISSVAAQLRLVEGWTANGAGLYGVGRALSLAPATGSALTLPELAAMAHGSGFDYVENTGTVVRVMQRAGEHIELGGPDEMNAGSVASFSIPRHDNPVDAVLAGKVLCTAIRDRSTVMFSDSTTGALLDTVPVGGAPVGIAATADRKTVYTASGADRTITALTVAEPGKGIVTSAALPAAPRAIAAHPNKPLLVILLPTQVVTVDTATLAIVKQWTIPDAASGKVLALNPSGTTAWVACEDKSLRAVRIDTDNGAWIAAPALTDTPFALAAGSTKVYATTADRRLSVRDAVTGAVTRTVENTDFLPGRLSLDEAAGYLYLGGWWGLGTVYRYNLAGDVVGVVATPGLPVAMIPSGTSVFAVLSGALRARAADAIATLAFGQQWTVTALWPLAPAGGRRLAWSVLAADTAAAHFDGSTGERAELTADNPGAVQVRVRGSVPGNPPGNPPYTVQIGLDQRLLDGEPTRPVVIRRDQYERIMNVLNELHPIGVEFDTGVIRKRVPELKAGQLEFLFPAYTYPTYRLRGQHLARPVRKD